MNDQLRPRNLSLTTQAAEGLMRRRWTVPEIRQMIAAGIILEDERFELIGGEVVPMSPKGNRHELVKKALQQYWFPLIVDSSIDLVTETTLYISDDEFLEPDFLFWPRSIALADVSAGSALLLVEVADASLRYDLGRKAGIYVGLGLGEYWVINADTLVTRIHREPASNVYASKTERPPTKPLIPLQAPALAVTLADLGLAWAT